MQHDDNLTAKLPSDQVVLFNCASGLKYPLPKIERKLDRHQPIDYAAL